MSRAATLPAPAGKRGALSPVRPPATLRIAVLGAGGYTGQELVRLARRHGRIEVVALCVREPSGRSAQDLIPGLSWSSAPAVRSPAELEHRIGDCDAIVSCLPHGAWMEIEQLHPGLAGVAQVIDLSSDHRGRSDIYAYGLPEAFRAEIAGASKVANPGCYATAAALSLLPAAESSWLGGPVAVSALSGASGVGRHATLRTSFVETEGGAWTYRAGTDHPHVAEIERTLAKAAGECPPIGFAPQVVPMARGILLTAFAPLRSAVAPAEAHAAYAARYADEPFVRLLAPGQWPETRSVRQSNRCDLAVTTIHDGRTLLVAAAIDNLVKGAAGQAIQNLNLMNGWPETTGLPLDGSPW